MSIRGFHDPEKIYKKSNHRRNDSGEVDVFGVARYCAGINESSGNNHNVDASSSQKMVREERQGRWKGGRVSLDMPMRHQLLVHHSYDQPKQIKENKHKQPSSPGGRLASFFNSLFSQAASKKKKSASSKSSTIQSVRDFSEEESPGGRRRSSSVGHFRTTAAGSVVDPNYMHSSSRSGFRTPPPYVNTPTKSYKDFRSYSDHKQVLATLSSYSINGRNATTQRNEKSSSNLEWLDEKFQYSNGILEKSMDFDHRQSEDQHKGIKKPGDVDDGGDSDSSSDLFELQLNYDFDYYSSDLPVYETTHADSIRRSSGTAIANNSPLKG